MIGNEKDALLIHNWWHSHRDSYRNPPEGWEYLGAGSFRAAYLSPSGVVYKVQKDRPGVRYQSNLGEWNVYKRLYYTCKMPRHSRLPKLGYFPIEGDWGVIAIEKLEKNPSYYERVKGTDEYLTWSDVTREVSNVCKIGDLFGDNVFLDEKENLLVPTDLGDSW